MTCGAQFQEAADLLFRGSHSYAHTIRVLPEKSIQAVRSPTQKGIIQENQIQIRKSRPQLRQLLAVIRNIQLAVLFDSDPDQMAFQYLFLLTAPQRCPNT